MSDTAAPKACYECVFFDFSSGSPGYSSWTPGSDMRFGCRKAIWGSGDINNESDFAQKITTAATCEEFERRDLPLKGAKMDIIINASRRIRAVDFSQQWFKSCAKELCLDPKRMHRKIWEFAIIAQVFKKTVQSRLSVGQYIDLAIGFGCGKEPIPAYIASYGAGVMATDSPIDNSEWAQTGQRVTGKSDIPWKGICHKRDLENLTFCQVDMNNIPDDLLREQFDFSWSCGSLEHIGGLDQSIAFFCNQMSCLRPGGIAAHTTEFNPYDAGETLNDRNLCLFRERDLIRLQDRLESQGDKLFPLDLSLGDMPEDMIVDEEPYTGEVHLSIKVEKWITTSVLLIAQKG